MKAKVFLWQSHVRKLFDEIMGNKEASILHRPLQITYGIICQAAQRAAEVNDEKLIGYFCRMAIYDFSDPSNPAYDKERTEYYISKTED